MPHFEVNAQALAKKFLWRLNCVIVTPEGAAGLAFETQDNQLSFYRIEFDGELLMLHELAETIPKKDQMQFRNERSY